MESEKKNYYEVLDINSNANPQEIENAYIRARNAYSGDSVALYSLMSKSECDDILNQIEEAYAILGFPEKRKEYDRLRGFNHSGFGMSYTPSNTLQATETPSGPVQYEDFGSNLMEAKVSKITAQKKFALEFNTNQEMENEIQNCSDYTGPFLKKIREYKNVSVERMAEMTRVSKTNIRAIENEEIANLPADVYVRGYIYQYAKVLKLNPDLVATSFLMYFKRLKSQK